MNKNNLKLDTGKEGLSAIWKDYELASLRELIAQGERTSGEVWKNIRSGGIDISRASVIFFLNRLVDEGLATFRLATGKGGVHRVYSLFAGSLAEFNNSLLDKFLYKLWEIFPENEKMSQVIKL